MITNVTKNNGCGVPPKNGVAAAGLFDIGVNVRLYYKTPGPEQARKGRPGAYSAPYPRTGDCIPGPAIFVRSCSRSPAYGTCRLSGTISFAESWKSRIPTGAVLFFRRVRSMPLNGEPVMK